MALPKARLAWAIPGLMIIAVALTFVRVRREGSPLIDLKIRMSAERAGTAQLYCDVDGSGFSEANSERIFIVASEEPVTYYWPLRPGRYGGLRVDPVNNDAHCVIHGAWVLSGEGDGEVVTEFGPSDFYPLANVASAEIGGDALHVTPLPGSTDPSLGVNLSGGFTLPVEKKDWLLQPRARMVVLLGTATVAAAWAAGLLVLGGRRKRDRGFGVGGLFLRLSLLVVIAAPVFARVEERPKRFVFQTRLVSPRDGFAEVFYDLDNRGFSALRSVRKTVAAGEPTMLRFVLPPGPYRRLRFDPIDVAVPVEFSAPRIATRDGVVVHEFAFEAVKAHHDIEELSSGDDGWRAAPDNPDPYLEFDVPPVLASGTSADRWLLAPIGRLVFALATVACAAGFLVMFGLWLRQRAQWARA